MNSKAELFQILMFSLDEVEAELEPSRFVDDAEVDEEAVREAVKNFNDYLEYEYSIEHDDKYIRKFVDYLPSACKLEDVYKRREQLAEWFNK